MSGRSAVGRMAACTRSRGVRSALLLLLAVSFAPSLASAQRGCANDDDCFDHAVRAAERGDHAFANQLYGRLCDRDVEAACNNLGVAYEEGLGVPADPERSVRLFKRSCRQGHARGCANAGRLYREGAPGLRPQPDLARRLLRSACQQRNALGCMHLGQMLEAAGAYEAARGRYQVGCEEGGFVSCHSLAMLYARGLGVPQDRAAARELLIEQCRAGFDRSCRAEQDLGCEDGDAAACFRRGRRLVEAARVAGVAPTDGRVALQRACDAEHAGGCHALAQLAEPSEQPALLARACELGASEACPPREVEPVEEEAAALAPALPRADAVERPSREPREPRGTIREQDVALLARLHIGGAVFLERAQSSGGAFHFATELGARLLLDPSSGFTLNPAIGGLLLAGDETVVGAQVGADLGFEIGFVYVTYGARFTAGSLDDRAFAGVRHGLFVELAGIVGVHVAHDVMFAEERSAALHAVTVSLSLDPGVLLSLALD